MTSKFGTLKLKCRSFEMACGTFWKSIYGLICAKWCLPPVALSVLGNLSVLCVSEREEGGFHNKRTTKLTQQHGVTFGFCRGRAGPVKASKISHTAYPSRGFQLTEKSSTSNETHPPSRGPRPSLPHTHIRRTFRPRALCHPKARSSSAWVKGATGESAQRVGGRPGKAQFPAKRWVGG